MVQKYKMPDPITWTNEKRKLSELVPWDHNPREINEAEAKRLGESLAEFGQIQTIAIGPDNSIYDGHQRQLVWAALPQFGADYEVDVRVSSRLLTDKERQKLVVFLHKGTVGDWNWDELANSFDVPELLEWGFEESELQLDWGKEDDVYSKKIKAPTYQITGECPELVDLYDGTRTEYLIAEIDSADGVTEEEKDFLRIAAQRHTALHFERIAEYYAHATPQMQELMENSVLVIIDFDKAISLGFVRVVDRVADQVRDEYGD